FKIEDLEMTIACLQSFYSIEKLLDSGIDRSEGDADIEASEVEADELEVGQAVRRHLLSVPDVELYLEQTFVQIHIHSLIEVSSGKEPAKDDMTNSDDTAARVAIASGGPLTHEEVFGQYLGHYGDNAEKHKKRSNRHKESSKRVTFDPVSGEKVEAVQFETLLDSKQQLELCRRFLTSLYLASNGVLERSPAKNVSDHRRLSIEVRLFAIGHVLERRTRMS
ncbi:hypothetical protein BBJ28_00026606, partial [Nothophytophthora sp. Chile5]